MMKNKTKALLLHLISPGTIILGLMTSAVSCHPLHGQSRFQSERVTEFPPPVLILEPTVCSERTFGEMILSKSNPTNTFIGAELVTITADAATLRIIGTGEYVSAKTNRYFRCRDFGTHGLLLRWVSKEKGQIGVERFGGTIEEQKHNPPAQATGKPAPDR